MMSRNRSRRAFVHGLGHRAVRCGNEVVELVLPPGVEQLLAVECRQHVDAAIGGLDERDVFR